MDAYQAAAEHLVRDRKRRNNREIRIAVAYGVLMTLLALFGRWPMLRLATAAVAFSRGLAAFVIWRHQRELERVYRHGFDTRFRLQCLITSETSFLRSSQYWYALPLGLGCLLVSAAFWENTHSRFLTSLCAFLALGVVIGSRLMNERIIAEMGSIDNTSPGIEAV